ncbi:MAG: hypothetical protein VW600_12205, partial [Ferrovibrio sp.]
RERLRDNDIDGYWAALAQHDSYAGLAGDVAANRGDMGKVANNRLDRFALEKRGRALDEAERQAIRHEVAAADLAQREKNLETRGDHRITGQQSVDYHAGIFETHGIPKEAYFPAVAQPSMGSNWGYFVNGTQLVDAPQMPQRWPTEAEFDALREGIDTDYKPVVNAPFREQVVENAKTLPPQGLMEIEGFHNTGNAPDATRKISAAPDSFSAQFAALPPSPQRWLDFTLEKNPGDLSERDLHALQAHDAYLKPQHPRRDEAFRLVSDSYRFLYGDEPQQTDATGRPQRGGMRRDFPDASRITEAERRRSSDLGGFGAWLDRRAADLGGGTDAREQVTGWLQRGLNTLLWPDQPEPGPADIARRRYSDGPVLVDGRFGPVTAGALDRAQAGLGLAALQDRIGQFAVGMGGIAPEPIFFTP